MSLPVTFSFQGDTLETNTYFCLHFGWFEIRRKMQNLEEVTNRIQTCAAYSGAYLELSLWQDACAQMFGSDIQHFVLSPRHSLFSWTACARRAPPVRSSFSLFLPTIKSQICDMICKRPPESRSYLRWQRALTPPCSSWGEMSTLPAQPQKHFITSGRLRPPTTRTAGSVESHERTGRTPSHRICTPPRLIAPFHTNWRVCAGGEGEKT